MEFYMTICFKIPWSTQTASHRLLSHTPLLHSASTPASSLLLSLPVSLLYPLPRLIFPQNPHSLPHQSLRPYWRFTFPGRPSVATRFKSVALLLHLSVLICFPWCTSHSYLTCLTISVSCSSQKAGNCFPCTQTSAVYSKCPMRWMNAASVRLQILQNMSSMLLITAHSNLIAAHFSSPCLTLHSCIGSHCAERSGTHQQVILFNLLGTQSIFNWIFSLNA